MKYPLVSIIVPVYNVERYIIKCIRSIIEQDYDNLEVILIDDCGGDNSISLVKKMFQDERIRIITQDVNRGQAAGRNLGIRESKGELIYFLDADDFIEQNAISSLVQSWIFAPDIEVVMASHMLWDGNSIVTKREFPCHSYDNNSSPCGIIESLLTGKWYNVVWNKLYKRSIFFELDLFFKEGVFFEDAIFNYQMALKVKKIQVIPDGLYYYRINNDSSTIHHSYNILSKHFLSYLYEEKKMIESYNLYSNVRVCKNYEDERYTVFVKSAINSKSLFRENYNTLQNLRLNQSFTRYYMNTKIFSLKKILCNIIFLLPKRISVDILYYYFVFSYKMNN